MSVRVGGRAVLTFGRTLPQDLYAEVSRHFLEL
jgi:hypothetical protein